MRREGISRKDPIDIYRETYLRNFGYLGIISGAFIRTMPLNVARMTCITYFISDMQDKFPYENSGNNDYKRKALVNGCDVLIFHFVSSLLMPTIISTGIKTCVGKFLSGTVGIGRIMPAILSVAFIPLSSKFIDNGTNHAMDKSYRKFFFESSGTIKMEEIRRKPLFEQMHDNFGSSVQTSNVSYSNNHQRNKTQNKEQNKEEMKEMKEENKEINKENNKEESKSKKHRKNKAKIDQKDTKVSEKNIKKGSDKESDPLHSDPIQKYAKEP